MDEKVTTRFVELSVQLSGDINPKEAAEELRAFYDAKMTDPEGIFRHYGDFTIDVLMHTQKCSPALCGGLDGHDMDEQTAEGE